MRCRASDRKTRKRPTLIAIGLLALVVFGAAADAGESVLSNAVAPSLPTPERMKPHIMGALDAPVRVKLTAAFRLAAGRVRDIPGCASLFANLGADGLVCLNTTMYRSVADAGGDRVCRRGWGAAAFTGVGSPSTVLCPALHGLTLEETALVVLHEALHRAGLQEWPPTPGALDSTAINRMVRGACGL